MKRAIIDTQVSITFENVEDNLVPNVKMRTRKMEFEEDADPAHFYARCEDPKDWGDTYDEYPDFAVCTFNWR